MSKLLTNRTDNDIKNKWNSMVRSRRAKILRQQQQAMEESPSLLRPRLERFRLPLSNQSPARGVVYLEARQNFDSGGAFMSLKTGSGPPLLRPRLENVRLPASSQSPACGRVYLEENQNVDDSVAGSLQNSSGRSIVVPAIAARKHTHPSDSIHRASMGASSYSSSPSQNRTGEPNYFAKQETPTKHWYGPSQPTPANSMGKEQSYDAVSV